jgi:predicted esterase
MGNTLQRCSLGFTTIAVAIGFSNGAIMAAAEPGRADTAAGFQ